MIRKVLVVLLVLLSDIGLMAQNYILEYDVEFFLNSDRRRFYNNLYYKTLNSQTRKEIEAFSMYRERRDHFSDNGTSRNLSIRGTSSLHVERIL